MRHVLVIAHQTAVGSHISDRVEAMRSTDPEVDDFVLVPAMAPSRPSEVRDGQRNADTSGLDRAQAQLAAALADFKAAGIPADGRVGDADPMRAARSVMETRHFDTIILCTQPLGASRWINMDLPHRLRRKFGIAVDHLISTSTETAAAPEPTPVRVLLVEDQAADIELVRQALEQVEHEVRMSVAKNGAEALEVMRTYGTGAYDLILLDLKMPVMNGHQFLEECGAEFDISAMNIVVLTTSTTEADRERAHALGAGAYVVKDPDFFDFCDTLDSLVSEAAA